MEALKKVFLALIEVVESTVEVFKDRKFSGIKDIGEYMDDIPEIMAAFTAYPEAIAYLPELKTDPAKRAELIEYIKEEFDIENDRVEAFVEVILTELQIMVTSGVIIFGAIKDLKE